jgi:hypothetical protein
MNIYWIPWILGILVPLLLKLGHHLFLSSRAETTFLRSMAEFVFADATASTTTVLTFATELLLGAIYINRLALPFVPEIALPLNWALCFFLAMIAESVAPIVVKAVVAFSDQWIKKVFG